LDEDSVINDIENVGVYKVLLLGTGNDDIIQSLIGFNIDKSIFQDGNNCLIEIKKTFNDRIIEFEFVNDIMQLPNKDESFALIRKAFKNYSTGVNIERFFNGEKIPSLQIKDFDPSLLINTNEDIELLIGAKLIKAIRIKYVESFKKESVISYINTLRIVTLNYFVTKINSIKSPDQEIDEFIISIDPHSLLLKLGINQDYNMVILNKKDDTLVKFFEKIINGYAGNLNREADLNGGTLERILKSVFYVTDSQYIEDTRQSKDSDQKNTIPEEIIKNNSLENRNIRKNVIYTLSYLLAFVLNERTKIENKWAPMPDLIDKFQQIVFTYLNIIKDQIKSAIPRIDDLNNRYNNLDNLVQKKLQKNRDMFFENYDSYLKLLHSFIKAYCLEYNDVPLKLIENIDNEKSEYTKKYKILKGLLGSQYEKDDEEFKQYIREKILSIGSLLPKLRVSIEIDSLNIMIDEIDKRLNVMKKNVLDKNIEDQLVQLANELSQGILMLMKEG
jgi:hypothetical protein